jgi:agmatine/peptidylarginine deiminase
LSKIQIKKKYLIDVLRWTNYVVKDGIVGDDTDGHIDDTTDLYLRTVLNALNIILKMRIMNRWKQITTCWKEVKIP